MSAAMFYPPNLPSQVLLRAFRAINGEIGVVAEDASAFLEACAAAGVRVLGWELWLVDHTWRVGAATPEPAPCLWCGGIPFRGDTGEGYLGGAGDLAQVRDELARNDLNEMVEPLWRPFVRINFTLDD